MRLSSIAVPLGILGFAALAVVGCQEKSLTDPQNEQAPSCEGLPIPTIACAVGPTVPVCGTDSNGRLGWSITCPGEGSGAGGLPDGSTDAPGGQGGTAGAGGSTPARDGGSDSGPGGGGGIGAACPSTPACAPGLHCTTEDGVCNPSTGCAANTLCVAVCFGTCQPPDPICNVDSDCQLVADYCGGCNCDSLGPTQGVPACASTTVDCFADPCMGKTARCLNGACVSQ